MTNEQLITLIKNKTDVSDNMLQLWQQNRGFVIKIANRYKGYEDIEDLEQQGYIGLCNAVEHYRPEESVPFINYAAFWIRQSMTRYIETSGSIVKIPSYARQEQRKYKKLVHEFEMQIGRKPTDREICLYMGISQKSLENVRNDSRLEQIGSLDSYLADDDATVGDLVPGNTDVESSVLDELEKGELRSVLWPLVNALPDEQQQVIHSLYQEGMTLKETCESLGVSLERVRTIRQTAFRELYKPSRRKLLEVFLPETVVSMAYRHNGIAEFNRTWTSSTEFVALKL